MDYKFYETASGREPVKDYIEALEPRDEAAAYYVLSLIFEHGFDAPNVKFRQIRGKLWEFYVTGDASHRIFYVTVSGPVMVLLHAYKKEGQKAPKKEIEVAERRAKEIGR